MKKIVELINPSDAITFEMDDVKVAGVAILILGRGAYGLSDADGDIVPIMLFGSSEAWLKKEGINLEKFIHENCLPMAKFLETVCYGSIDQREAVDVACSRMTPRKSEEHRRWWNDKRRSSLNDVGKGALALAKRFREMAAGDSSSKPLPKATPIILVQ